MGALGRYAVGSCTSATFSNENSRKLGDTLSRKGLRASSEKEWTSASTLVYATTERSRGVVDGALAVRYTSTLFFPLSAVPYNKDRYSYSHRCSNSFPSLGNPLIHAPDVCSSPTYMLYFATVSEAGLSLCVVVTYNPSGTPVCVHAYKCSDHKSEINDVIRTRVW